ncbi:MAG: hypothetical protein WBA17_06530, partial [Saprospiraceae bacterium]
MLRLSILCCFLIPIGLAAQSFQNTDFETPAGTPGQPAAWTVDRLADPATALVPAPGRAGRALRLTGPFTAYDSGLAYQEIANDRKELTRYTITGRIRTDNVDGEGAHLYAYGKGADGGSYIGYAASEDLRGTNDWTTVSLNFYIDARVDTIRLGCFLTGGGTAWFDDITWEEVPFDNLPPTDSAAAYLDTLFQHLTTMALGRE